MAIPLLESAMRLWGRVLPFEEAAYTLSDHEGGQEKGWTKVGSGDELVYDRATLYEECYKAYRRDPRAKNIIETYAAYIVGDGWYVTCESDADQAKWEEFARENKFDQKLEEIIRLTLIRGNHFVRIFREGPGTPQIRHLSALDVAEIVSDPEDVERVIGYRRSGSYKSGLEVDWTAEEVVHFRIGKLGNYLWGVPLLEPVLPDLTRYRAYLRAQALLWRIWLGIPLIRKGPWSTQELRQRRDDFKALPPPGTIITTSDKEVWEFPRHPGAPGGDEQSRELRLSIASGVGLPEYMVTQDASNSNYASTLVAEAPAMRRFRAMQLGFAASFEELTRKALGIEVEFGFKPLIPRDTQKEIAAWTDPYSMGAISWRTYLEKIGIDPAREEERMRMEGRAREDWG